MRTTRNRFFIALPLLGLVLTAEACAPTAMPPVAIVAAPKSQAGLTFFVKRPEGSVYLNRILLQEPLQRALQAALSEAGYRVVTNESTPHDVTILVRIENESDGVWGATPRARSVALVLEAKGSVQVAEVRNDALELGWSAQATTGMEYAAHALVNAVTADARVQRFALEHTTAPGVAVASLPAPPMVPPPAPATPTLSPSASVFLAGAPQPNAYAVVIGVEKYSNGLPVPTGARADAEHFAELAEKSLGVPADHVHLRLDEQATKGSILREVAWARDATPPGGRIYFYFSGHGAPDAAAGTPYLVPVDGDPKFLAQTALPEAELLSELRKSKAKEVLAVLDSCFSGAGGRSVLPPGARPLVHVKETAVTGQIAVFTASSGSEISGPAADGSGGLFTKFVLQGLGTGAADMDGDGQVTLPELSEWVRPRVLRAARQDSRDQTPGLVMSSGLGAPSSFIVAWGFPAK
jgi:hypothetical protein